MQILPILSARRRRAFCFAAACGLLAAAPPLAAQDARQVAGQQENLKELRERIESMQKELAESEASRSDAADQLRESEQRISEHERKLFGLKQDRERLTRTLEELARQSRTQEARLAEQQARLEQLLYRQYVRGAPDPLHLLLNGGDPGQLSRDLYYLSVVARARRALQDDLRAALERQQALAAETKTRAGELATVEADERSEHAALLQQKRERQAVLKQVAAKVRAQKQEIGALQRDEKRLSRLVDRLTRLLAEQERKAAAAAATAARQKQSAQTSASARTETHAPMQNAPRAGENQLLPEATRGAFVHQKGRLRLPARGELLGRFGAPREGNGVWKGLYILAPEGSEVKAVANGRVVYAEWMRGFGNLMIIDHGAGYLTVYGNNQSLLKQVGDRVHGGDTVGTVGSSGGEQHSGLYFELRHQGRALDPMKWVSLK